MRQQINIGVLKPHPKNNEFFDDLDGEEFECLKNSIRDEKIYTDILVSPDMTIISGHQRVRAAKELGMTLVPIKIDDDLQDEKSKLRALISNNFGRRKNNPAKDRKALATYVELKGYKHGEMENGRKKTCQNGTSTLDEIAKELNMSKRNLQRALRIERNLTDSMKELLDTGEITKTFASDTIASLTEEQQEELISKLDVTKKYTQKQIEKYIEEINNESEKSDDVEKLSTLKIENEKLEKENKILESQKKISDELAAQYKSQSDEYMEVKKKLIHMGLEPDDDYNTFQATVQITELNNELSELLQNRLAPIKYQLDMFAVKNNKILKKNFLNTLSMLNDWYLTMISYIGEECNEENIIDIETEEI
uniref:ParB-like N-terminal domain-containing protein n=1 Tax=Eubacterium plexicaudatum ASF492 TaxID=1235802 RepID=N2A5M4_9FIRM